jgi:hypothetical protein
MVIDFDHVYACFHCEKYILPLKTIMKLYKKNN